MKKIWYAVMALAVCLIGVHFSPPRVATEAAEPREIPLTLTVDGSLAALRMEVIVPRLSGPIVSAPLPAIGQQVKQGDVVAKIDGSGYEAELAAARSASSRTVVSAPAGNTAQIQSWYDMGAISKAEYDRMMAAAAPAVSVVSGVDRGAAEAAAFALSQLELKAGMDGIITAVASNPAVAAAGVPYVTIQQERPLAASFAVPEAVLGALHASIAAHEIRAWVQDEEGNEEEGEVTWLSPAADPDTHSALGKVTINNESGRFKAGEFYKVRLETKETVSRITVPKTAVRTSAGGDYVFLVGADGIVTLQTVLIGGEEGDRYYITGGLPEGARVIIQPGDRLQAGMKVKLSY